MVSFILFREERHNWESAQSVLFKKLAGFSMPFLCVTSCLTTCFDLCSLKRLQLKIDWVCIHRGAERRAASATHRVESHALYKTAQTCLVEAGGCIDRRPHELGISPGLDTVFWFYNPNSKKVGTGG